IGYFLTGCKMKSTYKLSDQEEDVKFECRNDHEVSCCQNKCSLPLRWNTYVFDFLLLCMYFQELLFVLCLFTFFLLFETTFVFSFLSARSFYLINVSF